MLPEGCAPELPAAGRLLLPPAPALPSSDNWPLLTVSKGFFETLAAKGAAAGQTGPGGAAAASGGGAAAAAAAAVAGLSLDEAELEGAAGWGDDLDLGGGGAAGDGDGAAGGYSGDGAGGDEDGGWDMEDLELPADLGLSAAAAAAGSAGGAPGTGGPFVAPSQGVPPSQRWLERRSQLAAEAAAAGDFGAALSLLHRQLGLAAAEPLRAHMLELHAASHAALPGLPGTQPLLPGLDAGWSRDAPPSAPSPTLLFGLPQLEEQLKAAYRLVTEGKFADALRVFTTMLCVIPLTVVDTRKEVDEVRRMLIMLCLPPAHSCQLHAWMHTHTHTHTPSSLSHQVKELVTICREYAIAMRCELRRKELREGDAARAAELAAYFTHCNLQPVHSALSLRSAMTAFFKLRNLATCAHFARRLLELSPGEKVRKRSCLASHL